MNKRIIIWLSVLVIVGMCGFGWVFYEKTQLDRQTAEYMAEYGDGIEEMLAQYEKWMKLPDDERMDPASLPDFYGNSDKQSEQDQRGRLLASLPQLASGEIEVTLVSDYIYGSGWIEEVERYNNIPFKVSFWSESDRISFSVNKDSEESECCIRSLSG